MQLPEAFHLLMRQTLGPAASRCAAVAGGADTESLGFTAAAASSLSVAGTTLGAVDPERLPHERLTLTLTLTLPLPLTLTLTLTLTLP